MTLANSPRSFGGVTRLFHWMTALLILTAIPLGVVANRLPYDTSVALAQKAQLFSLHKTLGIAAFVVAALRILWATTQTRPAPLHPARKLETALAASVHWMLYISLLAVPLSGWVHHAATSGFAPILWPQMLGLGQDLPLVPKSEAVAQGAASLHWIFTKGLIASILLHIAGALKHHLIDKDATLRRMLKGVHAPATPAPHAAFWGPAVVAVAIYTTGAVLALTVTLTQDTAPAALGQTGSSETSATGNWQVNEGTLSIRVTQLGSAVSGRFDTWTARIIFDDGVADGPAGQVLVTIDTTTLTLGSVSQQAKGPDFLDSASHSNAVFSADIIRTDGTYRATGTLTLRGTSLPLTLPFTLAFDGDRATMSGSTRIDRRDYGMGPTYPDEATVGFGVAIDVSLTAQRADR